MNRHFLQKLGVLPNNFALFNWKRKKKKRSLSCYRTPYLDRTLWFSIRKTSTCSHSLARNWQLPFLDQQKGENDYRKYIMINLHEKMLPNPMGIKPATIWSPVRHASERLFVIMFYCPVNPMGSCQAWSVYLTTFSLGRLSPLITSIVSILSPETDNEPLRL